MPGTESCPGRRAALAVLVVILAAAATSGQPNWRQRTPVASPPVRNYHDMAYDAHRRRVVLFGGYSFASVLNDTWEWDGNTWTQRQPATSPSARSDHAMAYDANRRRVVLFAGKPYGVLSDETWEWDGATWSLLSITASPWARGGHAMVYDAARQHLVVFAGSNYGLGYHNDVWEYGLAASIRLGGAPRLGSTLNLSLSAMSSAGQAYQAGSSSGIGPIWIGGRALGLGPDGLLVLSSTGQWPAVFQGYRGMIHANGQASAAIAIPPFPALVGRHDLHGVLDRESGCAVWGAVDLEHGVVSDHLVGIGVLDVRGCQGGPFRPGRQPVLLGPKTDHSRAACRTSGTPTPGRLEGWRGTEIVHDVFMLTTFRSAPAGLSGRGPASLGGNNRREHARSQLSTLTSQLFETRQVSTLNPHPSTLLQSRPMAEGLRLEA